MHDPAVAVGSDSGRLAAEALEHVSDGVILVDRGWQITLVNTVAATLVDNTVGGLVGRNFWDVFPEAVDHEFGVEYRTAMRTGVPARIEAYYGPLRGWFDVRATPSEVGLTLTFQNVNDRRDAAEAQTALISRLEDALFRQSQTQSVVMTLSEAISVNDVANSMLHLAKRTLGTAFAGVALLSEDEGFLNYVTLGPQSDTTESAWLTIPLDVASAVTDSVKHQQTFFHSTRGDLLEAYPNLVEMVSSNDNKAYVSVPLMSGNQVIGALSMAWTEERTFDDDVRGFIQMIAAQCALALQRALLITHQREVAETLQQAMLPEDLPVLDGLAIDASYLPATTEMSIGGDWYDAFVLPDGHLALVVGDVSGHGVEAAAVMGQVRNGLRAYLIEGHRPAEALRRLDRLVEVVGHGLFATVVVATYQPSSGELTWSNAGHPPMVLRGDAGVRLLEAHVGAPVGVGGPETYVDNVLQLAPGESIVAYTDGLVERRDEDLDVGFERLLTVVDRARVHVDDVDWCDEVIQALLGGDARDDDIGIIVLQRT